MYSIVIGQSCCFFFPPATLDVFLISSENSLAESPFAKLGLEQLFRNIRVNSPDESNSQISPLLNYQLYLSVLFQRMQPYLLAELYLSVMIQWMQPHLLVEAVIHVHYQFQKQILENSCQLWVMSYRSFFFGQIESQP